MSASFDDLVEQLGSDDVNVSGLALGELVQRGRAALPALLAALQSPDANRRALAAEGLAAIGDPAGADALAAALNDGDERVRSQAATGLARLNDPRAIDALIRTLNDNPDLLRAHLSLSAYTLMAMGPATLPAVAPLLRAADEPTRTKAWWIIMTIASSQAEQDETWADLQALLEPYDAEGPAAERDRLADAAIAWIARHHQGSASHD